MRIVEEDDTRRFPPYHRPPSSTHDEERTLLLLLRYVRGMNLAYVHAYASERISANDHSFP